MRLDRFSTHTLKEALDRRSLDGRRQTTDQDGCMFSIPARHFSQLDVF